MRQAGLPMILAAWKWVSLHETDPFPVIHMIRPICPEGQVQFLEGLERLPFSKDPHAFICPEPASPQVLSSTFSTKMHEQLAEHEESVQHSSAS